MMNCCFCFDRQGLNPIAFVLLIVACHLPDHFTVMAQEVERESKHRENYIQIAAETIPIRYEDESLSRQLRDLIAADLADVAAYVQKFELEELKEPVRLALNLEDRVTHVTHRLRLGKALEWYPAAIEQSFGLLCKKGDVIYFIITKSLSNTYIRFLDDNRENQEVLLGARSSLKTFLDTINRPDLLRDIIKDETRTKKLFYFHGGGRWTHFSYYQENIATLQQLTYRYPSIFAFSLQIGSGKEEPGNTVVFCRPVITSKTDPDYYDTYPPLAYSNGNWYICVSNLP